MAPSEETQIIQRVLAGDCEAFERIYRAYFRRVYAVVIRRTGDPDEAEDLVQTAFVRAFLGLRGFRGDAAFSTWLIQIALNVCASHGQRRQVRQRWLDAVVGEVLWPGAHPGQSEDPEMAAHRAVCRERVRQCIRALPGGCRDAMWLRYVEDYSYAEIEEELGVPMGTVKTWLHRGRELLRQEFCATWDGADSGYAN